MNKIAIVFWSGTGNTEAMADYVAEGVRAAGGETELMGPGDFSAGRLSDYNAVAFGCPAMGSEVLEEMEFEPMFAALEGSLSGQWMRDWCQRCDSAGANLLDENGLAINETPDAAGEEACKELGRKLAAW